MYSWHGNGKARTSAPARGVFANLNQEKTMNTKNVSLRHARRLQIAYPLAGQIVAAFSFNFRVYEASILEGGNVSLDWIQYENLATEPRTAIALAYFVAHRFFKDPARMRAISVDDTDWFGDEGAMPQVPGIRPFDECDLIDQFRFDPAALIHFLRG
jgi:hypothetical protein